MTRTEVDNDTEGDEGISFDESGATVAIVDGESGATLWYKVPEPPETLGFIGELVVLSERQA